MAAAVNTLLADPNTTKDERDHLANVRGDLEYRVLSLLREDGLFRPIAGENYKESPVWVTPLSGMALVSLLRGPDEGGTYGVLDPRLFTVFAD